MSSINVGATPSGATLSVLVPELVGVAQEVDDDGVGAENSGPPCDQVPRISGGELVRCRSLSRP